MKVLIGSFSSQKKKNVPIFNVYSGDGEAKFWIEPEVSIAQSHGFSDKELRKLQKIVEERKGEITEAWEKHFRTRNS